MRTEIAHRNLNTSEQTPEEKRKALTDALDHVRHGTHVMGVQMQEQMAANIQDQLSKLEES